MSLLLDGTGDYLNLGSVLVAEDQPVTMCAWVRTPAAASSIDVAVSIGDAASGVDYNYIGINYGSGLFTARAVGATAGRTAAYAASISANTWYHLAGVFNGTSYRAIYTDGVIRATNTADSGAQSGFSDSYVGELVGGAASWEGHIVEVAVWDVALSEEEVASVYARGPMAVRPNNLVAYLPCQNSPWQDWVGGTNWTANGNATAGSEWPSIRNPLFDLAKERAMTGISCGVTIDADMSLNFDIDLLSPVRGQTNVGVDALLEWRGQYTDGRPLDSDLVWDVYFSEFGAVGGLVLVASDLPAATYQYDPSDHLGTDMDYGVTYWWRVVARRTNCPSWTGLSSAFNTFTTVGDLEARRLEAGDYVFGYVLFNSETGRTSAFSEVGQVRRFEFTAGDQVNALYVAMEIVYDSVKYDQAFIYRSVKVQDAGGTYIAAIMHLENIIDLVDYQTINNAVGEAFPPSQAFRQAVYYYQLEDKQLVQKEPFVGHNIFDEEMPHGGAGMMFHGSLVVGKIRGGSSSASPENRQNDAFTGLGELRWSSDAYFSPELFPPLNRAEPETPSNEVINLQKAGHNGIGFSVDRMYHLRKEGDTVRSREIHKGYGLVNHRATDEVGSVIFFVSKRGLKTVDAFAKLDEIHALDEVIVNRWGSNVGSISVAHDASMGALFIHNADLEEAMVVWFNTAMLTSLDDMAFELVVRGAWPEDYSDYDDTLISRCFFLKNVPWAASASLEHTVGKKPEVMVVDRERIKKTTWQVVKYKALRMMDSVDERGWGVVASVVGQKVTFDENVGTDLEGGYVYVLQDGPTAPATAVGEKFKIHGVGDGTDPKALWLEGSLTNLVADSVVALAPVHVDVREPALGLVGEDGTPFSGPEYHRMRQLDALGAVMTDVATPSGLTTAEEAIQNRFFALVFRGSGETPIDREWPRDLDGSNVVSVEENEGVYFAAFGGDDNAELEGRLGVQGTVLIPGFETFTTDMDYRLLSLLATGKILDTERREQPTV